ncbi:hypothetical protein Drorol1_Dr00011425 [Drosera rotundifolia]
MKNITKLHFSLQNPTHILLTSLFLLLLFLSLLWIKNDPTNQQQSSDNLQCACEQTSVSVQKPVSERTFDRTDLSVSSSCTKAPISLAGALVHYVTTSTTPQQTHSEISVTLRVLESRSPCKFLVFGLGHDSLMWAGLNYNGRTVFVEEDRSWISQIKGKWPELEVYWVTYETKVRDAEGLLRVALEGRRECEEVDDPRSSKCNLALKSLPKEVYEEEWDLIMVDAPTGYHDEAPGRMSAIYTAGLMARNRADGETDVFVHDVDRVVEDKFSKTFLCEGYMREQEGRLRHFTIPSHKSRTGRPFCPPISP